MNTNEQTQYEPCALEEATHIKTTTGQIYELDDDGQVIIPGGGWVEIRDFLEAPTPVRKSDARPVEFVARAKTVGDYSGESVTIIEVPAEYAGKTFQCVEVTK